MLEMDRFFNDVQAEYHSSKQKFPENLYNLNALVEEVGELSQAMLQLQQETAKGKTAADVRKEAVQVANMALRIAIEGDSTLPAYRPEDA